jgi:hypothetical protein
LSVWLLKFDFENLAAEISPWMKGFLKQNKFRYY